MTRRGCRDKRRRKAGEGITKDLQGSYMILTSVEPMKPVAK